MISSNSMTTRDPICQRIIERGHAVSHIVQEERLYLVAVPDRVKVCQSPQGLKTVYERVVDQCVAASDTITLCVLQLIRSCGSINA